MYDYWTNQQPIVGKLRDFQPLSFVLVNGTEDESVWNHMVRTWHYLGYDKMIGPRIKYLVLFKDMPIAAISFHRASLKIGVRDSYLGWGETGRLNLLNHIVNNNRFLILPWIRIKNLASHILSQSLRLLQCDWPRIYGDQPYAVETFVDFTRYQGTCYKAANWRYLGETRGFGKVGKTFVYHGNRKGVFFYLINRKLLQLISQYPLRPNPNLERVRLWDMMLSTPDWSPDLFTEAGLNEQSVADLGSALSEYLNRYSSCFSRSDQQQNGGTYIKGLLSDLDRKSIEPIALRYEDEKAVRTLQLFLKDAPWDDQQMKRTYQSRVCTIANDPNGMITIDGSDFGKKGTKSAGVWRQYCGSKGKVENCQAGVFIGYSGIGGYGLLDARLYLPEAWFDGERKAYWSSCGIPETTEFRTKPQLALEMIQESVKHHAFQFKWIGCDGAFGCDAEFRKGLPESVLFFADIHSNQRVFRERPNWALPERKGRGKPPTKLVPSVPAVPVSSLAQDESLPWEEIVLMEGSKGPVRTLVKYCRVIELQDGKDGEELWLYIRKYEDGRIKYAVCNAPEDIDVRELHHAATLRWPIEQSFQECKSFLGMAHYETRSYIGWHRHMLLVMVAHLFVLEVRKQFQKKTKTATAIPS
ncbi:IS701 family transposase [Fodinisporobacter ferrooxydans]|uniref:IS701 family transposase n=1 Tax=Fodinisporobacter ferrooxydans TaxID=2901836 RepID=A0ABY4CNW4_9BACL|nr:IS701 family transposase [Alicyclobacillaceae bacterium MYW30-H2]